MPETYQLLISAIGVLAPVFTLVYSLGAVKQRLISIEHAQQTLLDQEDTCQTKREAAEARLHERINKTSEDIARIKGKLNGHG